MNRDTAIGAIKITAEIAHRESKAARGKLDSDVLIGAVVIGGAGWTCLRKDSVAGRSHLDRSGVLSIGRAQSLPSMAPIAK
jgi:hypothetical protein